MQSSHVARAQLARRNKPPRRAVEFGAGEMWRSQNMRRITYRFSVLTAVALLGNAGLASATEPTGATVGATGGATITTTPTINAATPGSPTLNAANPSATGPAAGT